MAHFIGYVKGQRAQVSRLGSKASGITATAQGWDMGGRVSLTHRSGIDILTVTWTPGSNGNGHSVPVVTVKQRAGVVLSVEVNPHLTEQIMQQQG